MPDIVVVGHILEETIILPDNSRISPVLGGPSAYASAAASRLGASVGLITKASPAFQNHFLPVFKDSGVDLEGLRYETVGTRNLLRYKDDGTKELEFISKASSIEWGDIPPAYHSSPYWLICPIDYEVTLPVLHQLYLQNKTILVDLGGYGGAASRRGHFSKVDRLRFLRDVAKYASVIKASEEDCERIFEETADSGKKLSLLRDLGMRKIVLTMGENGALVQIQEEQRHIASYQTHASDATGAGDTWCGAFLTAYSRGNNLFESAEYANAAASIFVESGGGVKAERAPIHQAVLLRMERRK